MAFHRSGSLSLSNWSSRIRVQCPAVGQKKIRVSVKNTGACAVKIDMTDAANNVLLEKIILPKTSASAMHDAPVRYVIVASASKGEGKNELAELEYVVDEV